MDTGWRNPRRTSVSRIPQDVRREKTEIKKQNVDQRVFLFPELLARDIRNGRVGKWFFTIV